MSEKTCCKAQNKQDVTIRIKELVKKYNTISIVNMNGLPSLQLQRMIQQLKGKASFFMAKKRLIVIAFKDIKKDNISSLLAYMDGMPALILSNEDPFRLYNEIKKSKSSAAAKPGQTAPKDLIITAGPTPFQPGPIIGELGQLGIKTSVENGKIAVKEDKVLVKEGAVISEKAANLLTKLGIEPMEIGLNVLAIYDHGIIYGKDTLNIDEAQIIKNIKLIVSEAISVAINLNYITDDTVVPLLTKAIQEYNALDSVTDQKNFENNGANN
ncbi:MAG: 50S ribosomal protein L10 [Nanoarchaeota archaeon]